METGSLTRKTIRDIDTDTYQKFKGKCAELKLNMGKEVSGAMKSWLQNKR